ncbi:alpha/beta fold hydrolase [Thetidibacter halocola]|uniref:Alpha/beta hydrolase n=1 Tax=Thetidibacter halocola TaxID=2827239 RepID=A0A8J7WIJ3_9RHOB|nr:alpha/beta hydrolase [Thetidibacter halocola]MBS0125948.1 alpha/beta hydrolase [Thetidibacter halocola]
MHSLPLPEWQTVIRWSELPGEGPAIVCLPGFSFSAVPNFLPMMTRPEFRGRRVLMVDYIGSGLSGHSDSFGYTLDDHARSIAAVLDTACNELVQLLGYSMGGSVAIALAQARPDLVARLVVCEGNLIPGGGAASRRIAACDPETFVTSVNPDRMQRLAQQAVGGDSFAGFLWAARQGGDPRGLHGNARTLVDLSDDFLERFLTMSMKRHFVYGEKTLLARAEQPVPDTPEPELLRAHGVGVHVIPGVDHAMMIDDPVACASVLGELFRL